MRKLRTILGLVGVLVSATVALALTVPPTYAPREFQTQQVHYFRVNASLGSINGQGCVLAAGTCSVKIGAVPYNSFIKAITIYPVTTFNSGTTDTLAVGTATGSGNIMAATSVHTSATASVTTTTLAGFGLTVTGGATVLASSIAPTGSNGGFDIWVTYAQTGSVATQGQAILLIDYAAPNDGTCTMVPLGSTAVAC